MEPSPRIAAVMSLFVLAVVQVGYGVCGAPVVAVGFAADPSGGPWSAGARALLFGGALLVSSLVLAAFAGVGALGVASGRPWGWVLGVISSALWLPSGCLPVSVVSLAALLHPEVRGPALAALREPVPELDLPDELA